MGSRGLTTIERSECSIDEVNEAIDAVLDGSSGTAPTVLRMEPVTRTSGGGRSAATVA